MMIKLERKKNILNEMQNLNINDEEKEPEIKFSDNLSEQFDNEDDEF